MHHALWIGGVKGILGRPEERDQKIFRLSTRMMEPHAQPYPPWSKETKSGVEEERKSQSPWSDGEFLPRREGLNIMNVYYHTPYEPILG